MIYVLTGMFSVWLIHNISHVSTWVDSAEGRKSGSGAARATQVFNKLA
jgi:hypothetical protein